MTEPLAGTRRYRARVARGALAAYDAWKADESAAWSHATTGELASCARWLLETLDTAPGIAAQRVTGQANTAVAGLSARQLREVLYALAADQPRAVLNAIAEAGH